MPEITKTYNASFTFTYDSDDTDVDIEDIASNYETWIHDTIADDNCWGEGSVEVDMTYWKESKVKKAKNK